ncbi:MAG: glycine cleavage system protein R [Desulfatibacillaceae bacterium]
MSQYYMVAATGPNVSGIVAKVSKAIHDAGGNFEDSSMNFVERHFTLMILVSCDGDGEAAGSALREKCRHLGQDEGLNVALFPMGEYDREETFEKPKPNYELRVSGEDRMGLVYRTSQLLASLHVNIVEMSTQVRNAPDDEDYTEFVMRTKMVIPKTVDVEILRKMLESLAEGLRDVISLTRIKNDRASGGH